MADNYLERRMEDLKAGRLKSGAPVRAGTSRKGYVEFPFPSRRVLVVGKVTGAGLEVVRAYLKAGCKVAVFDADKKTGDTLAYKEGVRFCCVDVSDKSALENAFTKLVDAWRDVDIVVVGSGLGSAERIARLWAEHRKHFPVPFGYGGRMIMLAEGESCYNMNQEESDDSLSLVSEILCSHRITVNAIVNDSDNSGESISLGRLCMLLSLPGTDFIDGQVLRLNL